MIKYPTVVKINELQLHHVFVLRYGYNKERAIRYYLYKGQQ